MRWGWLRRRKRSSQAATPSDLWFEFALLDSEDTLFERNSIRVTREAQCTHLMLFNLAHQLEEDAAKIVLSEFSPRLPGLTTVNLHVPLHQSTDWESLVLAGYTLAFRCSLTEDAYERLRLT